MSARVIAVPEKIQKVLGVEATEELVKLINEVAATTSSTKVDKADYDAHVAVIKAEFQTYDQRLETFKAEVKASIRGALLTGLAWVTVLIGGLFGALYTLK